MEEKYTPEEKVEFNSIKWKEDYEWRIKSLNNRELQSFGKVSLIKGMYKEWSAQNDGFKTKNKWFYWGEDDEAKYPRINFKTMELKTGYDKPIQRLLRAHDEFQSDSEGSTWYPLGQFTVKRYVEHTQSIWDLEDGHVCKPSVVKYLYYTRRSTWQLKMRDDPDNKKNKKGIWEVGNWPTQVGKFLRVEFLAMSEDGYYIKVRITTVTPLRKNIETYEQVFWRYSKLWDVITRPYNPNMPLYKTFVLK
tara:strand:- start:352 stop:1095 length:744 start_codon:yes stop_codon:yes gene_type:complete